MPTKKRVVLEDLAAGKITIDQAEKLLNRVDSGESNPSDDRGSSELNKARFVRIAVDSPEGPPVSLRVPISLLQTGMRLVGILPAEACEKLAEINSAGWRGHEGDPSTTLHIDCG